MAQKRRKHGGLVERGGRLTPKLRIALYCICGITVPFSLLMIVGAAIGGVIPLIPT
ncbi:hypothetical protein B0T14DRAFT_565859 [Immersiella caudata]|uniref:Uncharacterized protein n=1 Tax=Immersiella caudata TaxID=314043 RepID=A0AA39WP15_9PEZI|nr:hypothetical protein B0T14DRAFT_565859 [Immersiella caudata]